MFLGKFLNIYTSDFQVEFRVSGNIWKFKINK